MKYSNLVEQWGLCTVCNRAFDCQETLLRDFLKEDFGCFPISQVSKDMINARKKRALGKGAWRGNDN